MTLSQIIRGCRWEDVSRYVKEFDARCIDNEQRIAHLEQMFYEMQRIEPEGEGLLIQLHRYNDLFDDTGSTEKFHPFNACVKVVPRHQLFRYMWSRYLGAEIEDMGKNGPNNSDVENNSNETHEMPAAAVAANMLIHLSGHGYSQAEVEDNIKRSRVDDAMGYSVRFFTPNLNNVWSDEVVKLIRSKVVCDGSVKYFLEGVDSCSIRYFTTYFSTLYGWSKRCFSSARFAFSSIIRGQHIARSMMIIATPPTYKLSKEAISTIEYQLNAPFWLETLYYKDESLTDRIRVEAFINIYNE